MTTFYNHIAGQNLCRLKASCEAQLIYAVAPRFKPFSWL
jgi:hypothetical protein